MSEYDSDETDFDCELTKDALRSEITKLRADLAAANERERKMLEIKFKPLDPYSHNTVIEEEAKEGFNQALSEVRAILTDAGKSASTEKEPNRE